MGCSAGKVGVTVEASMQEVRANPLQGLPLLKDALEHSASPGQEESAKNNVPQVFQLLSTTMGGLQVADWKAVVAAGAVVERCVKLINDPGLGLDSPAIDPQNLNQCIIHFSALLKRVLSQGPVTYVTCFADDQDCSMDATAIAGAMKALFKLEDHAMACRREFTRYALKDAILCVRCGSGLTPAARQALLTMFVTFLEEPKSAQDLIDNDGIYVILPYCADPKTYGVSKKFQLLCAGLLEDCMKNGQWTGGSPGFTAADVEAASKKARNTPCR